MLERLDIKAQRGTHCIYVFIVESFQDRRLPRIVKSPIKSELANGPFMSTHTQEKESHLSLFASVLSDDSKETHGQYH